MNVTKHVSYNPEDGCLLTMVFNDLHPRCSAITWQDYVSPSNLNITPDGTVTIQKGAIKPLTKRIVQHVVAGYIRRMYDDHYLADPSALEKVIYGAKKKKDPYFRVSGTSLGSGSTTAYYRSFGPTMEELDQQRDRTYQEFRRMYSQFQNSPQIQPAQAQTLATDEWVSLNHVVNFGQQNPPVAAPRVPAPPEPAPEWLDDGPDVDPDNNF